MRDNILTYYDARKPPAAAVAADMTEKQANKKDAKAKADWQKTIGEVEQLRQYQIPSTGSDPNSDCGDAVKIARAIGRRGWLGYITGAANRCGSEADLGISCDSRTRTRHGSRRWESWV